MTIEERLRTLTNNQLADAVRNMMDIKPVMNTIEVFGFRKLDGITYRLNQDAVVADANQLLAEIRRRIPQ